MSSIPACRIDVNYLKYADPLFLFSGGNLSLDRTSLRAKSSDESPGEFSCCTAQEISVDEKLRKDRKLRNASKKYRERKERRRQRLEAAQAGASTVSSSTSHEIGSRQQGTIQGVARAVSADEVIFVPLNADGKENDYFLEPNKSPSSGTDDSSEVSSSVEDENESIDIQKIYSADTPLVDMGGWGSKELSMSESSSFAGKLKNDAYFPPQIICFRQHRFLMHRWMFLLRIVPTRDPTQMSPHPSEHVGERSEKSHIRKEDKIYQGDNMIRTEARSVHKKVEATHNPVKAMAEPVPTSSLN